MQSNDSASKINRYSIRYSLQNIDHIIVYKNGHRLGFIQSIQLLGQDDKALNQFSLLERKIANALAKQAGLSSREWIHFLGKKKSDDDKQSDETDANL